MEMPMWLIPGRRESFRLTADAFTRRRKRSSGRSDPQAQVRQLEDVPVGAAAVKDMGPRAPLAKEPIGGTARGEETACGLHGDNLLARGGQLPPAAAPARTAEKRGGNPWPIAAQQIERSERSGSFGTAAPAEWKTGQRWSVLAASGRHLAGGLPGAGDGVPETAAERRPAASPGMGAGRGLASRWEALRGAEEGWPAPAPGAGVAQRRPPAGDLERIVARLVRRERLELAR